MRNQPFQFGGIALQDAVPILLEADEKFHIADNAALDGFIKAGAKLAVGQCLQNSGIDQHDARMVKGSDQILPGNEINSGLSADGGVDLREHGCGHLHKLHAPHVE